MAAETKTGFLIDGTIYEPPKIDTLDLDEAEILYNACGIEISDLAYLILKSDEENEEIDRKTKSPGFFRALAHIAYRRAHRDMKPEKIAQLIGSVNWIEAISALAGDDDEGGEGGPPAVTPEPSESSPNGSGGSSKPSGTDSTNGSEEPAVPPTPTGTTR